jgi:hypothetical protein
VERQSVKDPESAMGLIGIALLIAGLTCAVVGLLFAG